MLTYSVQPLEDYCRECNQKIKIRNAVPKKRGTNKILQNRIAIATNR